jgi:DNA repair protein RecO
MKTKIEGLILTKNPYRERDLVCKVLLRSGKIVTVMFFGGQGGGAKKKSSFLELGHLMKIELSKVNKKSVEMYTAKEYSLSWRHEKIRLDHAAFYLMCFFLEVLSKVAVEDNLLQDEDHIEHEGIFRVASNALFYLEDALVKKEFDKGREFLLFMTKLLFELGVAPDFESCSFCDLPLHNFQTLSFHVAQGGFSCPRCEDVQVSTNMGQGEKDSSKELQEKIKEVWTLKYSEYQKVSVSNKVVLKTLFNYFCYQFQFGEEQFKTLKMVLS